MVGGVGVDPFRGVRPPPPPHLPPAHPTHTLVCTLPSPCTPCCPCPVQAAALKMPETAKTVFKEELDKLGMLERNSSEFNVTRSYLDWLTSVPWGVYSKDNLDIDTARMVLDEVRASTPIEGTLLSHMRMQRHGEHVAVAVPLRFRPAHNGPPLHVSLVSYASWIAFGRITTALTTSRTAFLSLWPWQN